MRRRTVRNGMRLLLAALLLIILASFYHAGMASLFSFAAGSELRFYSLGMLAATAMGGYGIVMTAFGLVLPVDRQDDATIRIAPLCFMLACAVALFFCLFALSFSPPAGEEAVPPGGTITI